MFERTRDKVIYETKVCLCVSVLSVDLLLISGEKTLISDMLKFLGKVENVVCFQKFCGLKWAENVSSGVDWGYEGVESSRKDSYSSNSSEEEKQQQYNSNSAADRKDKQDGSTSVQYTYNPIIHKLFFFGAELGNEIFYITFLPFVYWNIDDFIARRLIMLWVFNMYAGQGLKDVLCWPRPRSPPVLRLETNYAAEYGMPSTHAIAGSIIPFGIIYFSYGRFEVNLETRVFLNYMACLKFTFLTVIEIIFVSHLFWL